MSDRNCPFYGVSWTPLCRPFMLLGTGGNQCALMVDSHSPCKLEIDGQPVDWKACPRVAELRVHVAPGDFVEL